MAARHTTPPAIEARDQRIGAILNDLRPQVEQALRRMVERAVDVPEKEEFGAIDLEFRDAGLTIATAARQATLARREKRGT